MSYFLRHERQGNRNAISISRPASNLISRARSPSRSGTFRSVSPPAATSPRPWWKPATRSRKPSRGALTMANPSRSPVAGAPASITLQFHPIWLRKRLSRSRSGTAAYPVSPLLDASASTRKSCAACSTRDTTPRPTAFTRPSVPSAGNWLWSSAWRKVRERKTHG